MPATKICEHCKLWVKYQGLDGCCHRHSPTTRLIITTDKYLNHYGIWPKTTTEQFCGDWEAKDASIH